MADMLEDKRRLAEPLQCLMDDVISCKIRVLKLYTLK